MSISAGKYFPDSPNAVTINFPRRDHPEFAAKYPDFHSYAFGTWMSQKVSQKMATQSDILRRQGVLQRKGYEDPV